MIYTQNKTLDNTQNNNWIRRLKMHDCKLVASELKSNETLKVKTTVKGFWIFEGSNG